VFLLGHIAFSVGMIHDSVKDVEEAALRDLLLERLTVEDETDRLSRNVRT